MCLGIPGKIETIFRDGQIKMGKVNFEGVQMDVCLETTPEAEVGDYVIVHAGLAISVLDETEAQETLKMFEEMKRLDSEANGAKKE
jgi:hydrogenase expression/formation protein HypC